MFFLDLTKHYVYSLKSIDALRSKLVELIWGNWKCRLVEQKLFSSSISQDETLEYIKRVMNTNYKICQNQLQWKYHRRSSAPSDQSTIELMPEKCRYVDCAVNFWKATFSSSQSPHNNALFCFRKICFYQEIDQMNNNQLIRAEISFIKTYTASHEDIPERLRWCRTFVFCL